MKGLSQSCSGEGKKPPFPEPNQGTGRRGTGEGAVKGSVQHLEVGFKKGSSIQKRGGEKEKNKASKVDAP